MACNNCPKVDCQSYPDAHCVVYTGPSLTNLGVSTNTRLDVILQKINQFVVNGGGSSLFTDDTATIDLSGAGTNGSHLSASLKVGAQDNSASTVLTWTGSAVKTFPISSLRDNKVKVSANDTTAGYLNGKLVAGSNIALAELNDGSNESLRISCTFAETDAIALARNITINQGSGILVTGTAAQSLESNPAWSVAHADTSNIPNVDTSGAQVIDTITFDGFGHVQTVGLRTLTLSDIGYSPVPYPVSMQITGTATKTVTLFLSDSSTITASFTDLNTGSGGGSGLTSAYMTISDGSDSATASGPDTITFRSGNNLLDIAVTSNDATYGDKVQYTVNQTNLTSFIKSTVKAIEVRFKVGHSGSLANAGDTSFILKDCAAVTLTNRVIKLYIEGLRKYYEDDYVYDPSTATITLISPLAYGQRVIIEVYPAGTWDECSLNSGEVVDFPYDLPFGF